MDSLLRAASGPTSPAARQRQGHGRNFRRNTLAALAICLIILGFAASPDVLQKMQHHTLTVEECTGSKCTTEVVNVHDTAILGEQQRLKDLQSQTETPLNSSQSQLGSISIQKQVGKPLVVTVKQDDSDPGQQVQSGGALLTDEAKDRVASLSQASSQQKPTNPGTEEQRASDIADELSKHNAAAHREGDNILEIHRDDIDLSSTVIDPAALSNLTHISDDNNLQIMQDTDSSSLLSGFNSEKARAQTEEDQTGGVEHQSAASRRLLEQA